MGKRRYGLDKIMTKLLGTSETVIALIFMVMNLDIIIHFLSIRLIGYTYKIQTKCVVLANYLRRIIITMIGSNLRYRQFA